MSLLIALEGININNKTSLISRLKKSNELNLMTCNWKETELGEKIANLLNEAHEEIRNHPFLNLLVLEELASKKIRPNLKENKIVIVDEYIDNILVYQDFEKRVGIDIIQKTVERNIKLEFPDITFILDVDLQEIQKEIGKKWDNSNYQRIRDCYLKLKDFSPERVYILSAHKNQKELLEEIQSVIKKLLPNKEEEKNLPSLVRVIIKNEKGELLLVKDKKWGWNLPGGKIELGETPEIAACREVFEETNLVIENTQKIGKEILFFANLPIGKMHSYQFYLEKIKKLNYSR